MSSPPSHTIRRDAAKSQTLRTGLTEAQKNAFKRAADRWSRVIVGDLPSVIVGGEVIDDLLIEAQGVPIDGTGSILGQAGPTNLRPASAGVHRFLPAKGIMSFDTADLASMEANGTLVDVITHEMGHVGVGTIWDRNEVSLSAAEPYSLPNLQALAEKGLLVAAAELAHAHALPIFSPKVLPDASLVV